MDDFTKEPFNREEHIEAEEESLEERIHQDSGAARFIYCPKASRKERNKGCEGIPASRPDTRTESGMGIFAEKGVGVHHNNHPTVKPQELMRYLVKLIAPPGGTVLDPFAGSGSTGVACKSLGLPCILIEQDEHYCEIAKRRIIATEEGSHKSKGVNKKKHHK